MTEVALDFVTILFSTFTVVKSFTPLRQPSTYFTDLSDFILQFKESVWRLVDQHVSITSISELEKMEISQLRHIWKATISVNIASILMNHMST